MKALKLWEKDEINSPILDNPKGGILKRVRTMSSRVRLNAEESRVDEVVVG